MRHAKPLIISALLGLALTGSALAQNLDFDLTDFDKIDIASGIEARVSLADQFSVQAQSRSQEALDGLDLRIENGVLTARIDESLLGKLLDSGAVVQLDIAMPALGAVTASSGAAVSLQAISADSLRLDASTGADIVLDSAQLGELIASASAGADIRLAGEAGVVRLAASDGSTINAEGLEAGEGQLRATSGSDIGAHITEIVDAQASTGGDITITGNARQRQVQATRGGDVRFAD